MKLRSLHSEKAALHLYFLDFVSLFFFFSLERYLKTGVSHLQLITFLVFYQEFKILTVSMWWHKREKKNIFPPACKITLRFTISSVPLCSMFWSTIALNYSAPRKEECHAEGKIGKRQETSLHLSARAELLWLKFTFPRISLIAQCWTVHGGRLVASRSAEHSGSFNNIFLKIVLSQKKKGRFYSQFMPIQRNQAIIAEPFMLLKKKNKTDIQAAKDLWLQMVVNGSILYCYLWMSW